MPEASPKGADALPLCGGILEQHLSDPKVMVANVAGNLKNLECFASTSNNNLAVKDNLVGIIMAFIDHRNDGTCPSFLTKWCPVRHTKFYGDLSSVVRSLNKSKEALASPKSLIQALTSPPPESDKTEDSSAPPIANDDHIKTKPDIKTGDLVTIFQTRYLPKKTFLVGVRGLGEDRVLVKVYPIKDLTKISHSLSSSTNELCIQAPDNHSISLAIPQFRVGTWSLPRLEHVNNVLTLEFVKTVPIKSSS